MNSLITPGRRAAWLTAAVLAACVSITSASSAQERSVLDRMFGSNPPRGSQPGGQDPSQEPAPDQVLRIERLETQIRELTGQLEQMQFRNRQLESQIRSMGGQPGVPTAALPAQPVPPGRPPVQAVPPAQAAPPPYVAQPATPVPPAAVPGRRSDVFDPTQDPNAPGAPRTLGSLPSQPSIVAPEPSVGVPGGRTAGEPLDLSTLSGPDRSAAAEQGPPVIRSDGPLPPPPARNPNATGAVASVAPPSDTPKDNYDLAYGYVLRKDYALAETSFQSFLKKYPTDRRAPEAQFWLGESLFQRQQYDAAAAAFLDLSTKHASHGKAPEALLRLGQLLAAMKQKEMACATLAEISRKYPRAPNSVKQGVEREQKRVHC